MTTLLPELTAKGLVLWRLRWSPEQPLWCSVCDGAGGLTLTVHNPATDQAFVTEDHPTITILVDRAADLRDQLVAAGWKAVDVDLDEPD